MHKYLKMCSLISCHVVCIVEGHKVSAFLLRKISKVSRCPLSIVGASCDSLWRGNPMVRFGIAHARGESGKEYSLLVYPWGTNFKKGFGAVYFVTNRYLKKDGIHVHGGVAFTSGKQKTYQLNSMTTTSNHVLTNTKLIAFASTKKRIKIAGHTLCRT